MSRLILLDHLRGVSPGRPPGYYEDVISRGKIEGVVLILDDIDYDELLRKYGGPYKIKGIPEQKGAGSELKKLLAKLGLNPAPNCKCGQHILEMDQKGIEWCAQNIHTIVGWLKEEATRANLPFFEIGAKIIVKRAISNARKKQLILK